MKHIAELRNTLKRIKRLEKLLKWEMGNTITPTSAARMNAIVTARIVIEAWVNEYDQQA